PTSGCARQLAMRPVKPRDTSHDRTVLASAPERVSTPFLCDTGGLASGFPVSRFPGNDRCAHLCATNSADAPVLAQSSPTGGQFGATSTSCAPSAGSRWGV